MRYQLLGDSGLRVSQLALGTMGFMESLSWGTDKEASRKVYDAFVEVGGNFIDTANTYGDGMAEEYLADFIVGQRESIVLTTKYGGRYVDKKTPAKDPNCAGSQRKSLKPSVEESLRRLKTDYIDLLWVHAWDFLTPTDEVMRSLDDLVSQGKVLYTGVSNAPAWTIAHANTLADMRGWTRFAALQVEFNVIERTAERELLPMADALGLGVTAWTPLASGLLTGKYRENGQPVQDGPRRLDDPVMGRFVKRSDRNLAIVEEVRGIAEELQCRPAHVALNWLRRLKVIPIFGARTTDQVRENAACFDFSLSDEHFQRLCKAGQCALGYPHDFLASSIVKNFVYGGMYDAIDKRRPTALAR